MNNIPKERYGIHTRIDDFGQGTSHEDDPRCTTACIIRMKLDKAYVHKHVLCVLHFYAEFYQSSAGREATRLTLVRDMSPNM